MARNFRRQRSGHAIADLNVTNLIDLGFILLVIFMIATPLIQQEQSINVNLPAVSKAPQDKVDSKERFVAISVDPRGFYIENRPTPLSLAELRTQLRAYAAEPKPPVIRVRGDANVRYQKVAELLTEMQKAGLTRFTQDFQIEP